MYSSRSSKLLNLICVLMIVSTGFIRLADIDAKGVTNLIILMVVVAALFTWMWFLKTRIIGKYEKIRLIGVAILLVIMMFLRTVKYELISNTAVSRYFWYIYYILLLLVALWSFFAVYDLSQKKLVKSIWKSLLYVPTITLCVLVLTNDAHQLVFRFQGSGRYWSELLPYEHGPVYHALVACITFLFLLMLIMVIKRVRIAKYRKNFWMPVIPSAIGIAYIVLCHICPDSLFIKMYRFQEVYSLVVPMFLESLMYARFIPSNENYFNLWNRSEIPFGVISASGQKRYESLALKAMNEKIELEDILNARTSTVTIGSPDHILKVHKVRGGYAYRIQDNSEINRVNDELKEFGNILSQERELQEKALEIQKYQIEIKEKNILFKNMIDKSEKQIEKLQELLESVPEDETAFENRMKLAAIYQVYIKRHSNMILNFQQGDECSSSELNFALEESLEYLRLYGIEAYGIYEGEVPTTWGKVAFAYESFQKIMEDILNDAKGIFISVIASDQLVFSIQISNGGRGISKDLLYEIYNQSKDFGTSLEFEREEDTDYLTLKFTTGGGQ